LKRILPILISTFLVVIFGFVANYYLTGDDEVQTTKTRSID